MRRVAGIGRACSGGQLRVVRGKRPAADNLALGGVVEEKANDETDPLILKAVETYVKAEFGLDNDDAERYRASYKEQRNGLTLSDKYIVAEGG